MKISGRIVKKKAVELNDDSIRKLCKIIEKYSNKITFEAETVSEARITFDSLNELLNYDNYKPRRLSKLSITGYVDYRRVITVEIGENFNLWHFTNYDETIQCFYQFTTTDHETLFLSEFDAWYNTVKSGYWLVGKFSFLGAIFVPSLLITFFRVVMGYSIPIDISNGLMLVAVAIGFVFGFGLIRLAYFIDKHFWGNVFPSVIFLWGEEIKRNEKWAKFRSSLFGGIIMTLLLGLVTNYLYDTLKGI